MYARLAVTCHLHFWQNDRGLLCATAVAQGWNGYRNKSQHRKLTLEKKILPLPSIPLPYVHLCVGNVGFSCTACELLVVIVMAFSTWGVSQCGCSHCYVISTWGVSQHGCSHCCVIFYSRCIPTWMLSLLFSTWSVSQCGCSLYFNSVQHVKLFLC